jgi:hypothetical protein
VTDSRRRLDWRRCRRAPAARRRSVAVAALLVRPLQRGAVFWWAGWLWERSRGTLGGRRKAGRRWFSAGAGPCGGACQWRTAAYWRREQGALPGIFARAERRERGRAEEGRTRTRRPGGGPACSPRRVGARTRGAWPGPTRSRAWARHTQGSRRRRAPRGTAVHSGDTEVRTPGKVGWTHGAGAHVRATQRGDVGAPAVFHSI